jgi:hypothetical protein
MSARKISIIMLLVILSAGCKSWGKFWVPNSFVISTNPAYVGSIVTLGSASGFDFNSVQTVKIGETTSLLLSKNSETLKFFVMPGTTSGQVNLLLSSDAVTSEESLTILQAAVLASQQGPKLVGTGNVGAASQGYSVALSSDGSTAMVGARQDNTNEGAVWVFTRSGTAWLQQGTKITATGNIGAARLGQSVALSAEGNTAIVGAHSDNANTGAAFIFVRSGAAWSQQAKLVGTGSVGASQQGFSVSISADGNTAAIGGNLDNSVEGGAWVFVRSGTAWVQQGTKLVGTGNATPAEQGRSLALSADGNTLLLGGNQDNTNQGAGWVFTRSDGIWSQQGSKLLGSGNTGAARQGFSVALSADGNAAVLGGIADNANNGATWVFIRSGAAWSQQGAKLVGSGNSGAANQGQSVGISADGNTVIIGGNIDNSNQGAAWIFRRSGTIWSQQGTKLVGAGNTGAAEQGFSVSISSDATTGISGGYLDNTGEGAAWVWVP